MTHPPVCARSWRLVLAVLTLTTTTLPPEGTKIMTNLYPLPEDDVETLTLTTPQDGNIDGVAISEQ